MNHYYFKFGIENKGFDKWVKEKAIDKVELSIYYDSKECMWRTPEVLKAINHFTLKKDSKSANQIKLFFGLEKNIDEIYFWIFHNEFIYAFKGHDLNVKDGEDFMTDENGSKPKSISVTHFKKFKKIELPEFFSNINSNQKYNRGTIAELSNSEKKFATALITEAPISVDKNNFHEYLSPVEFETLIFLIFNQNGNYCSSFRGGTLKDYDLRISINIPIKPIQQGNHLIQVKKKAERPKDFKGYIINTEENKFDRQILGIDWVRNIVDKNESIINWLTNATFAYTKYIDFKW
jgi:hypothetical protein